MVLLLEGAMTNALAFMSCSTWKIWEKNNPGYGYEEWKIMHGEDGK